MPEAVDPDAVIDRYVAVEKSSGMDDDESDLSERSGRSELHLDANRICLQLCIGFTVGRRAAPPYTSLGEIHSEHQDLPTRPVGALLPPNPAWHLSYGSGNCRCHK